MATNLNYSVGVSTSQGVQALQNLQNKLGQTNSAFAGLKNAIAGIAVGAFVTNAFQAANALTDMAKAAGISTQALLGFRDAVVANGGEAQGAVDAMGRFGQAIDAAANGSKEAQDRLLQLGITLQDLRTLSEEDLLARVVDGLGKGTAGAETMAAAMAIFGKSFRSVDFQGVAKDIRGTTAAAKDAAAGYESAGETQQRFSNSIQKLQTELLKALTPISELAAKLLSFSDTVAGVIRVLVTFGLALATFTLVGKAIKLVSAAAVALAEGWGFITTAVSTSINFFKNFGAISTTISSGLAQGGSRLGIFTGLFKEFGAWIVKNLPALAALVTALYSVWDAIGTGINKVKEFLGFGTEQKKKAEEVSEAEKKKAQSLRDVTDAFAQQRAAIRQVSTDFSRHNRDTLDAINLSNGLIGTTKEYQDVMKAQEEIYKKAADESEKLRDAKAKLTAEEKRAGLGAEYDKQIAKIVEIAAADAARVKQAVENTNRIEALQQLKTFSLNNELELQKQLQSVQDDMAKMTMSEIEKKYYDIDAAAKASAKSAIDAEQARRGGAALNTAEIKAYYDEATKGSAKLKAAAEEQYNSSRSFSTGWKQAFNEYVENANNAANRAKDIFQKATQGMEDLIVNFAKTGKFEFKTFVASMVEDLLRSQLKQSMSALFNIGGNNSGPSGGSFFGNIASMLGFAAGGLVPNNKPILVGERGPEIISGMGGRTVTPNNQLGTTVNYNISAVDARSFKQMIAQDPSFLYAVTQQGARSIPGVR
jgi:hypothetical protein